MTVSSPEPPANVLIVDDVIDNLRVLADGLSREGFRVRPTLSGRLALEAARLQPPDLVLLDVDMPEMDGYAVCAELKADSELCRIPVVFVSALDQTFDKVRAFEVGGVDYVTKPVHLAELVARVRTQVRLCRAQRERERLLAELQASVDRIKKLEGLIPICASCKSIRDDRGYWSRVEAYITSCTGAAFSHGICPGCERKLYGDLLSGDEAADAVSRE